MKIFITGASGFIGGAIGLKLKTKHEVAAIARSQPSIEKVTAQGLFPVASELLGIQPEQLTGYDVVIHCAAFA